MTNKLLPGTGLLFRVLPFACLALGCAGGPGFTELDKYVIYTPAEFSENKVYFQQVFSDSTLTRATSISTYGDSLAVPSNDVVRLVPQYHNPARWEQDKVIRNGEPLSIIVNGVVLPTMKSPTESKRVPGRGRPLHDERSPKPHDIAVVFDLEADNTQAYTSLLVWYQRGVRIDQQLNFSNLLVYYTDAWDARIAPFFRIRVIDVTQEQRQEALAALNEVERLGASLSSSLLNPFATTVMNISGKAASLIMGNSRNKAILDFSVQFYSAEVVSRSGGAALGQIRRGPFIVLGRPPAENRGFWKKDFILDRRTGEIFGRFTTYARDDMPRSEEEVRTPYLIASVVPAESVVPKIVQGRSQALFEHFAKSQPDLGQLKQISASLSSSVKAFIVTEQFKRYRTKDALESMFNFLAEGKDSATPEDFAVVLRTLRQSIGQDFDSPKAAVDWWVANSDNVYLFSETGTVNRAPLVLAQFESSKTRESFDRVVKLLEDFYFPRGGEQLVLRDSDQQRLLVLVNHVSLRTSRNRFADLIAFWDWWWYGDSEDSTPGSRRQWDDVNGTLSSE